MFRMSCFSITLQLCVRRPFKTSFDVQLSIILQYLKHEMAHLRAPQKLQECTGYKKNRRVFVIINIVDLNFSNTKYLNMKYVKINACPIIELKLISLTLPIIRISIFFFIKRMALMTITYRTIDENFITLMLIS